VVFEALVIKSASTSCRLSAVEVAGGGSLRMDRCTVEVGYEPARARVRVGVRVKGEG